MFPELKPALEEALEMAPDGADYVVDGAENDPSPYGDKSLCEHVRRRAS